jgi:hypothetical protein
VFLILSSGKGKHVKLTRVFDEEAPAVGKARELLVKLYLHGAAAILKRHRDAADETHMPVAPRIIIIGRAARKARRAS